MYSGNCLCGGVTFRIKGELAPIQMCHCVQCRKAQGTAFVTNIPVPAAQLEWLSGESLFSRFESSPGKCRVFCRNCGSPLFSETSAQPGMVRIRAGLLNGELATRPVFHIFTDHKANWFDINDGLPQHAEWPPR